MYRYTRISLYIKLAHRYGSEVVTQFLLKCLVGQQVDLQNIQLVQKTLEQLPAIHNSLFAHVICQALEGQKNIQSEFLHDAITLLKLSTMQQLFLACSLRKSYKPQIKAEGMAKRGAIY